MVTEVASLVAEFVVPGLGEVVVAALGTVGKLVTEMKENEEMCKRVLKRMTSVHEELLKLKDDKVLREKNVLEIYGTNIASFVAFLKKQANKGFIRRLTSNRKVVEEIQDFHVRMDDLFKLLNLTHIAEMSKWKQEWEQDKKLAMQERADILANNQAMKEEISRMGNKIEEGIAQLVVALRCTHGEAGPEVELLAKTYNKVVSLSKAKVPMVPSWYIPSDEVHFDLQECLDLGSYGSVHHGTWGKGTNVVVKCLLTEDQDEKASDSFYKEVEVWYKLNNLHVVRLFGACHLSKPAFFVCEDAVHGNFANYFEKDKSELWRFFHEAALGLFYLHSQKVVHGDLKCSNIVIGADRRAKLCDFGFSFIRAQSVGLSAKPQADAIRWKAPECLLPVDESPNSAFNPRFASDVYSFGMRIVEAFLGHPPYELEADETVMERRLNSEMYPRVDGMSDEEWTFVERLLDPDWKTRVTLADAIDTLKMFADRERAPIMPETEDLDVDLTDVDNQEAPVEVETATMWMCSYCTASMPIEFKYCGNCSEALSTHPAVMVRKRSCESCSGGVLSTDHFCRHCGQYLSDVDV